MLPCARTARGPGERPLALVVTASWCPREVTLYGRAPQRPRRGVCLRAFVSAARRPDALPLVGVGRWAHTAGGPLVPHFKPQLSRDRWLADTLGETLL